ncbi:MAG: right-handed parallel beta-helix repeat-containing protein, partial [Gemmatimonadaceae bacterium]
HAKGNDAQGICVWSGAGPFLIENNRIEGSGQAIMFGGADPAIRNVVPSDIIVRHNYFYKPLSWFNRWTIKATFELKNAKRVIFEGNVLENHWADAQIGFAILLQSVNQDRSAPWSTVTDVLIQNNVIKNSTGGVNLLARFSPDVITPTSRILIRNNLFQDVGHDPFSGQSGRIFQILGELEDVTFANNTATTTGNASHAVLFDGNPGVRTTIVNNIFPASLYGIFGSGYGVGTSSTSVYAPGGVISGNVLPTQPGSLYPANNYFPESTDLGGVSVQASAAACDASRVWTAQLSLPSTVGTDCVALQQATVNSIGKTP